MPIISTCLPRNIIAMAIWPFILIKKGREVTQRTLRHEQIHHAQQKELLLIFFYLWYLIEYLIRLAQFLNHRQAYRNISFEREAYENDDDQFYLKFRHHFNFLKYL
jgi:hypothetical protein